MEKLAAKLRRLKTEKCYCSEVWPATEDDECCCERCLALGEAADAIELMECILDGMESDHQT